MSPIAPASSTDPPHVGTGEPLLVVVGATASRKTHLAVSLAELQRGEVVSADSVQVYRHFDVGSGKPDADELRRAPHHMVGVREPTDPMDASEWATEAEAVIRKLLALGKTPIVCGGTFLWVRALLFGLADAPPRDPTLRRHHEELARNEGRASLHRMLGEVDPQSAARLHENDFVRVSRALEVHQLTGRPLSAIQAEHGFRTPQYQATLVGIDWPRQEHDRLIEERVSSMLAAGWVQETRALIERGYEQTRAMQSVGYRQVHAHLTGGKSGTIESLRQEIVRATRIFARRQRTWLREQNVLWLDPAHVDDPKVLQKLTRET